jgi:hypothetical protein
MQMYGGNGGTAPRILNIGTTIMYEISGSHGGEYEDESLLG